MLQNLCAGWQHYTLDALVVIACLIFAIKDCKKGFVDCVFSLLSSILAITLAFVMMNLVLEWTGGLFGLQGVLEKGCGEAFMKIKGFDIDVSNQGIETALSDKNIPKFLINMVIEEFGNAELAAGTTIAMIVGESLGGLITGFICSALIFIVVKLLFFVLRRIITSILEQIPIVGRLNHLLGFLVGALKALLIFSIILAIFSIIPSEKINSFFNECIVVGWLYNRNPINVILSWILV